MPESLAGLQRLQELDNGRDTPFRQEHAAQAAKAAEDLLQLCRQCACWEVLSQDHSLTSLCCSLRKDERMGDNRRVTSAWLQYWTLVAASVEKPHQGPQQTDLESRA